MTELKLLDRKALAELLDVHPETVTRWKKRGKIPKPIIEDGRTYYWSRSQIEDWQKAGQQLTALDDYRQL